MRTPFLLGGAFTFLLGLGFTLGIGPHVRADGRSECSQPIPTGSDQRAAEQVLDLFVGWTVGRVEPGCGTALAMIPTERLPLYATRHPDQADGWFQLAPLVRNVRGTPEYAAFVYLHAPDTRPAAFELLLELHGTRWLVSHAAVAPGSAELELSNLPT